MAKTKHPSVRVDLPASPRQVLRGLEYQVDALRGLGEYFHQRGWSLAGSGAYSTVVDRRPLELLITASRRDKGRLTRTDFVRINAAAEPTTPNQPPVPASAPLHLALAETGAGAVLHTTSVWSTILSDHFHENGGVAIKGYSMLHALQGAAAHDHREWIPIFENAEDVSALTGQIRDALARLDPRPHGFLIRRDGLYTWGEDLDEARRHVEALEFLLEVLGRRL